MKYNIKDYMLIAIGSFFIAAGLNMFLISFQLSSGGIGTLGTILLYIFKVPLSVTNLLCNVVLFILGYRFLGKEAVFKTIAGILFLSLFLELTTYLPVFKDDILLSVICGGILDGIGIGLVVRVEGSTGGVDFAGLIIKRFYPHISVATSILIINCVIIAVAGVVFHSYTVTFYSILAMYVSSKVTDVIMNIGDAAKSIHIISENKEEIEKVIIEKFERGVTEFYSRGAYSQEEKQTLLCVVKPKEAPHLVKEIHSIDKNAFIIISDAREVLGEGFKAL